jgi:hypothetical protein
MASLAAPTYAAAPDSRVTGASKSSLCRAIEYLVLGQRDFQTSSGGARASWAWRSSDDAPALNTGGLIAHAIATAGAGCSTGVSVERFAAARADDLQQWQLLYDGDVEALAAASRHDPRFLEDARLAFERRYSGASGRELVERWFMVRHEPELVAFDIGQAIRAALAVGNRDKARELADAAESQWKRWAANDHGVFFIAAAGALLEALFLLDASRYAGAPDVARLREALLQRQGKDGSWSHGQTQATAYAVRALSRLPDATSREAAERGRAWLECAQKSDGSWASDGRSRADDEIIYEVVAEAALALHVSAR